MTLPARALLDTELNTLNQSVVMLASLVDTSIGNAVEALITSNAGMAQAVVAGDAEINKLRFQIEEEGYKILSTQQPLARDLRTVIAAIHFAVELERIGDHAAGIARIVTRLEGKPLPPLSGKVPLEEQPLATADAPEPVSAEEDSPPTQGEPVAKPPKEMKLSRLPKMAKRARDMLNRAITAFINRDVEMARAIINRDQKIDRHYRKFFAEAMEAMNSQMVTDIPTYLLWIAHDLERIGDRTTNLAERVIFMVTGQYTEVIEEYE